MTATCRGLGRHGLRKTGGRALCASLLFVTGGQVVVGDAQASASTTGVSGNPAAVA